MNQHRTADEFFSSISEKIESRRINEKADTFLVDTEHAFSHPVEQQIPLAQDLAQHSHLPHAVLSLLLLCLIGDEDSQSADNVPLESPKGIIIFSLDREDRYTVFTRTHAQAMQAIWGKEIKVGMSMLDCIGSEDDKEKAKRNFDRALAGLALAHAPTLNGLRATASRRPG